MSFLTLWKPATVKRALRMFRALTTVVFIRGSNDDTFITVRIIGFADFVHLPEFEGLENSVSETGCVEMFRRGEGGTYSVGYLSKI
jgi:hypothetical protein